MVTNDSRHGAPEAPIVHVVGARPNFPKMAPVEAALRAHQHSQLVVHTGQHFDTAMSETFFSDLGIPTPDVNLDVHGGSHADLTARVMIGIDRFLDEVSPLGIVVYGDVNSTLAATLVAVKREVPVVHVEAGLRSGDRSMPEEINRIVVDALADLLLATSPDAIDNLRREGRPDAAMRFVGNTMIDSLVTALPHLPRHQDVVPGLPSRYAVATFHRPANVDTPEAALAVVDTLRQLTEQVHVVLPLHPRSRAPLDAAGLGNVDGVTLTSPLPYLEFIALVRGASLVVTDSGGIQEESTWLGVPCLTFRDSTERPITLTHGTNRLVGIGTFPAALRDALQTTGHDGPIPPRWDGHAGERAAAEISHFLSMRGSM